MTSWTLANVVLGAHITLFVVLVLGLVLAAAGWMRRRTRVAAVFWPALVVTVGWQALPGCALTTLERWLRWRDSPGWDRDMSILRTVLETVAGTRPPWVIDYIFPVTLAAVAVYAFGRYHLRDALALARRAAGRR